jgi:thiamine transporter
VTGPVEPGSRNRVLAEAAVMVALSAALFNVKLFVFPEGGEVTLGSMTPIILLSLRRGAKVGAGAGVVLGMIVLYFEPFIYNVPWQVLLDYPLAYGALGLSGLVKGGGGSAKKVSPALLLAPALGIGGRFLCHFASGVIFFASYAPVGESPYVYSAIYNALYLVPELVITEVALVLLLQRNILNVFR